MALTANEYFTVSINRSNLEINLSLQNYDSTFFSSSREFLKLDIDEAEIKNKNAIIVWVWKKVF